MDIENDNYMKEKDKKSILEITVEFLSILGIIFTIVFLYFAMKNKLFSSPEKLESFLNFLGPYSVIGFIIIQIIQTVIPIIPGALTCPAGAMVFGMMKGFLYNWIGIMIGSILNFFIARKYGRNVVRALVGRKIYDKYIKYLTDERGFDKVFAFGMFFPVSPADFLCMLAGLSDMSFKKYITILALGKPFTLFVYTYGLVKGFELLGTIIGVN